MWNQTGQKMTMTRIVTVLAMQGQQEHHHKMSEDQQCDLEVNPQKQFWKVYNPARYHKAFWDANKQKKLDGCKKHLE